MLNVWQGPEYASAEATTWKVFWKIVKLQADSLQLSVVFPEVFNSNKEICENFVFRRFLS